MKTILVSGASGVVGYGVLKSLRQRGSNYRLIGTTIYDDSVAPVFCDILELAPPTNDAIYLDWLAGIIKKHKVDMIIPCIEVDMILWNKAREQLTASGAFPLLNKAELIELCADKWEFYQKLEPALPEIVIESRLEGSFEQLQSDFGLPFLLKPRRGFASKGIVKVDSIQTFQAHASEFGKTSMAQPIVGTNDGEYSISAFFDKESRLCAYMSLKRKLASEGFTEKAQVAEPAHAKETILKLAAIFKPVGPTNFQFRLNGDQLKLLEINPRVSSATSIRTAFGYNESQMSVKYFLDNIMPTQPIIRSGTAVRYSEDYIFYDSPVV